MRVLPFILRFKYFLMIFCLIDTTTVKAQQNIETSGSGYTDSVKVDMSSNIFCSNPDPWLAMDKGFHLIGSMMMTVGTAKTLEKYTEVNASDSKKYAWSFSLCVGLGKEFWDSTRPDNKFSVRDLTADLLGIIIGMIILNIE
jgi:uncharacterized protein YfiM (DUF2279 family)